MTGKKFGTLKFCIFLIFLFAFPCFADEILFQNQKGLQTGVVVSEDDQSVTVRFPKEAIRSITRSREDISASVPEKVIWEEGNDYLILKIPRRSIQIVPGGTSTMKQEPIYTDVPLRQQRPVQVEKQSEKIGRAGTAEDSGSPTNMTTQQKLLQEEMGSVRGEILWRGYPLGNAKVKIVLDSYTGFSLAALRTLFEADKERSSQDGIVLETQTDSQGRYVFHKVPPGYYRLYWLPDMSTGWIRRLRDKPDFEVLAGKLTIENVPEKKK